VNEFGCTIADLGISRFRLAANQSVPGYSFLICTKHVCEPFELSVEERAMFFDDMMRATQALWQVYNPVKMNYQILGNIVPHLHCHLTPRFHGDPAPGAPIHPDLNRVHLTPEQYEARVDSIRRALGDID
jgi:diadenosine tetraphosphate (Ap4A) HIT family hydrolase